MRSRLHIAAANLLVAGLYLIGGTLGFLAFVLYVPGLREVFGFTTLHANDVLLALAAGATGIMWFELFKWAKGKKTAGTSA